MNKKTKYFSIFDGEDYIHTGRNSTSKSECIKAGIDFLYQDDSKDHFTAREGSVETQESILNGLGYSIEEHDELISSPEDL